MIIDIVLLPPKGVSKKIGEFVRGIDKRFKLKMAVDNRKLLPHISLLHIKTSPKRIPGIVKAVGMISGEFAGQIVRFTTPRTGRDYFVMDVAKAKNLQALHRQVVFKVHKYKTGIGIGNYQGNGQRVAYVKKYGAGNVLKNFQPHITLGLVRRDKDLPVVAAVLSKQRWGGFKTNRLAITQVNHRHQVFKVIKELKLHG